MKIRSGFVSNSSSSSFVLLLPENWVEKVDYEKIADGDDEFPIERFKDLLTEFVNKGGMYNDDIYHHDHDYEFSDILYDLVQPYVIAEVEGGPDEGQYVVIDRRKVLNLLDL